MQHLARLTGVRDLGEGFAQTMQNALIDEGTGGERGSIDNLLTMYGICTAKLFPPAHLLITTLLRPIHT